MRDFHIPIEQEVNCRDLSSFVSPSISQPKNSLQKRHSFHLELKTPNGRQSAVFDIWGESTELSQSQISYVDKGVILKSLI